MIAVQIGIIVFLIFLLAIIYHDEHKRRKSQRKSAKLDRFWKTGEERRKGTRITTKVDVLYEVSSGRQTQKHSSISKNISLGGINLAMNEKLPPGTRLDLQLNITENAKPILVQGRIVWTKEISGKFAKQTKQRLFAAGIKFIQIKPADEAILRSFISQRIKNTAKQN